MAHYTEALQRMGIECSFAPYVHSIGELVERRGAEFDLVYITRYYVAQELVEVIRRWAPQARIVLNNADLHFLRELRAALNAGSSDLIERSVLTRDSELATMRRVDLVLSYSDIEKAVIYSHNLDETKVAKCPWVCEVAERVPGFEERVDIAFLGGFRHFPNLEAVEWFVENVMPLLSKRLPDLRLRVYGSDVPKRLRELEEQCEQLVIDGWVPTVDMVYDACRVFVAPLQSGAGIKGKVVAALAHGTPCVLSSVAAESIPVRDGVDAAIAADPEQWASAIVNLYRNSKAWSLMSVQARALVKDRFGFEAGVVEMQEALRQVDLFTTRENRSLVAR